MAIGSFTGGKLEYWPDDNRACSETKLRKEFVPAELDARSHTVLFDGRRAHAVTPFEGERYSMVFFTSGDWENASDDLSDKLVTMGSRMPTAENLREAELRIPRPRGYPLTEPITEPKIAMWPRNEEDQGDGLAGFLTTFREKEQQRIVM